MLRRLFLFSFLLLGAPGTLGAQSSRVDALFEEWDQPDSPGVAIAVVHNGEPVYLRGFGMANLEHNVPITPRTVFDIASVSKQFCAFAIAQLIAKGKLSLDDSVRQYIPEIRQPITIRHLIHHTSGLRDWPGTMAMAGWQMENVLSLEHILTMTTHQETLNFPPGTAYSYSNTGYNVLAAIVSRVTAQSYRSWSEKHIFRPLGMIHSHMHDSHEEVVPNRAYGYTPSDSGYQLVTNSLTALGSSSLFTTVEDLVKWVQNFRHQRVGEAATHILMNERGVLRNGEPLPYAFGHAFGHWRGLSTLSHTGSWAGFRSVLLRFPEQDFAIILLSNASTFRAQETAYNIAEIYLNDLLAAPEDPPAPVSTDIPDDLGGLYHLHAAAFVTVTKRNDALFWQATGEPEHPLIPVTDTTFYLQTYSALVRFVRDTKGHVTKLLLRDNVAPRVVAASTLADASGFEGTYHSQELDVSVTISVAGDHLAIIQPRLGTTLLFPAAKDTFTSEKWYMPVILFTRNIHGHITGLEVSNERSHHMRFEKRQAP